ncbi:MAG: amino acid adenylation domain-containing protein, partial [Candidatus Margulisbacteria bacterium]|nr:amino acid adenylation domain-containing protein [Candidatus Margulisiibacteriota bacterium]
MTGLSDISILTPEEKKRILEDFNKETIGFREEKTLAQIFIEQVQKAPEATALIVQGHIYSYQELNRQANRLAHLLIKQGVTSGSIVPLLMDYSLEMIVAVLAVWKAGGAYLPVDINFPEKRITQMLRQSKCQVVILQDKKLYNNEVFEGFNFIEVKESDTLTASDLESRSKSTDLAYVIFTSGSTGEPKGVMLEHRGVVSVLEVWKNIYELEKIPAIILQFSAFAHDVFTGNLAKTILCGGTLVLCTSEERHNYAFMYKAFSEARVNMLDATPALITNFLDYIRDNLLTDDSLKWIIMGSDICPPEDFFKTVKHYQGKARVFNSYGVTEATIYSSHYEGSLKDDKSANIPIGKPFPNQQFYILGQDLQIIPIGAGGDLYIGGTGLARGYLENEALTVEKFKDNPFKTGQRLYKTGDKARWTSEGVVEFLGRDDFQIKLLGYRVECSEIENYLLKYPEIKKVCVLPATDKKTLKAFYVAENELSREELKQFLQGYLPAYMLPKIFIRIEQLPLNTNGKVDRQALMKTSELIEADNQKIITQPENEFQQKILDIWKQVIKKQNIGIDDDFFDLGGDSMDAINLISRLEKLELKCTITDIYQYKKIKDFADYFQRKNKHNIPTLTSDTSTASLLLQPDDRLLNELQNLREQEINFYNKLLQGGTGNVYPFSFFYVFDGDFFERTYFVQYLIFNEEVDKPRLNQAVNNLFVSQPLLRSILVNEDGRFFKQEYNPVQDLQIPGLDLSGYEPALTSGFLYQVLPAYYTKQDRLRVFPFRILLVRIKAEEYWLIFLMDESIHDTYGEDIIKKEILDVYNNIQKVTTKRKSYQDFILEKTSGYRKLTPIQIMEYFELEKISEAIKEFNVMLNRQVKKEAGSYRFLLNDTLPEKFNLWEKSVIALFKFCKKFMPVNKLPLLVVHDCRAYDYEAYSQTIGGFTDSVPVLLDLTEDDPEIVITKLKQQLKLASEYKIHFETLLFNPDIPNEYKQLQGLLKQGVGDITKTQSLFLFHYYGHYSEVTNFELNQDKTNSIPRWL